MKRFWGRREANKLGGVFLLIVCNAKRGNLTPQLLFSFLFLDLNCLYWFGGGETQKEKQECGVPFGGCDAMFRVLCVTFSLLQRIESFFFLYCTQCFPAKSHLTLKIGEILRFCKKIESALIWGRHLQKGLVKSVGLSLFFFFFWENLYSAHKK